MPLDKSIKKVLVIGTGPGHACTQACLTLRGEGIGTVLVNSNPAAVMTGERGADKTYVEPLTPATIMRIIKKERPDSILSGFGGRTELKLNMQLLKEGVLEDTGIRHLGTPPEIISKAESRRLSAQEAVAGWKRLDFEVMRDSKDNAVIICSMESFDPVGINAGDSIAVAPVMTLNDRELQMLRTAALDIVRALGAEGACNIRFALHPYSMDYAVTEVKARLSRSSALAGKATGFPVAAAAAKIALGYTLDEVANTEEDRPFSAFEPEPGYVAVKLPVWSLDVPADANREPGAQIKATGEVMALAETFEEGILKAVRGARPDLASLENPRIAAKSDAELRAMLTAAAGERLFVLYQAIKRGHNIDDLHAQTRIDKFFLRCLRNIAEADVESAHRAFRLGADPAKPDGPPKLTYRLAGARTGGIEAKPPYFYSVKSEALQKETERDPGRWEIRDGVKSWEDQSAAGNEALPYIEKSVKPRIVVLGRGPARPGQGMEFDQACVHCARALREMGYEAILISNDPAAASACTGVADRLYFEPLCIGDVMGVVETEKPLGVIVAYGGEAALGLAGGLRERSVPIIGTTAESIGACKNREYFHEMLERLSIRNPGDEHLGGQLIEVDAISDGADIFIPGLMEQIGRTGTGTGDGIAVYPAIGIDDALAETILTFTRKLCLALDIKGLVNIKYIWSEGELFVLEASPCASRAVPYISKATGIPMCEVSTKVSLGLKLSDMGYTSGFGEIPPHVAVRMPALSSTAGEVLGIGRNLEEALLKGLVAAGYPMERKGGVLVTVRGSDKEEIINAVDKLWRCGFEMYATRGTAGLLNKRGYRVKAVDKIHESPAGNTGTLLESGAVNYVIGTFETEENHASDGARLRKKARALGIPCLMSLELANALAEILFSGYSEMNTELMDSASLKSRHTPLTFTKMHGCGNDYIYFDCFGTEIESPESLAVYLSDRNKGIGGDGIVLIMPSEVADARMRMFNIDGSEGGMCGNAIRCVGKYLYDNGIVRCLNMSIETKSGVKELYLSTRNEKVSAVRVDMGSAVLKPSDIPVNLKGKKIVAKPVSIAGAEYEITCVSMGNPHAVVFTEHVDELDLAYIGPLFERDKLFPDRVNAEFVEVLGRNRLKVRVWERGSGITQACGTGACAAAVAAVLNGHCDKGSDIKVMLPGGELIVNYTGETVTMTGEAVMVYRGVVEV